MIDKNPNIKNCEMYISDETTKTKLVIKGKNLLYQWFDDILVVKGLSNLNSQSNDNKKEERKCQK